MNTHDKAIPRKLVRMNSDTPNNSVRFFNLSDLKFPLSDIEKYELYDADAILSRQCIFRDIYNQPKLFGCLEHVLSMMEELSSFFVQSGDIGSNEAVVYSLLELRAFGEIIDYLADECRSDISVEMLISQELIALFEGCAAFAKTEQYISVRDWLENLDVNLKHIRSVTLGVNLDAQLRISEVGIVSFNEHPYVGSGVLDNILRDKKSPESYKCIASLGIHETRKLIGKGSLSVNQEFFTSMNALFKGAVKNIHRYVTESFKQEVLSLMSLKDDLAFIVRAARYMTTLREFGLRLTFPSISENTEITDLVNPNLIDKCKLNQIIANDVRLDARHRIYILTGPNSGGKSVYLGAVGIAQTMFQLGLPIPAQSAVMKPCDVIAVILVKESQKSTVSRLAGEVIRLRECLDIIGKDTLLVLDETFSSTSAYDGVFLAESLVKYLVKVGCFVIYATHLHELSERLPKQNPDEMPVHMLAAKNENGRRTYKIAPASISDADSSLARDIVIENGLGFLFDEKSSENFA